MKGRPSLRVGSENFLFLYIRLAARPFSSERSVGAAESPRAPLSLCNVREREGAIHLGEESGALGKTTRGLAVRNVSL